MCYTLIVYVMYGRMDVWLDVLVYGWMCDVLMYEGVDVCG